MKIPGRLLSVTILLTALLSAAISAGGDLYFVDAHSQVDHRVTPLDRVISSMEQGGVAHTILSARGKLKGAALVSLAARYEGQLTLAVRTKGEPYETGSAKYYKQLERQVASGAFSAMAEVLLYHAQKGNKAPEYVVHPEDKRVRAALEQAIAQQWPFVVHIEFGAVAKQKKRFMHSLKRMLAQYPEHPFVLTHMGQLGPRECLSLIEAHKNLHFHTGWTNPTAVRSSKQPWVNLFRDGHLAPEWRELMVLHPERIIFALDNVFAEHWSDFYVRQMRHWRTALAGLPPDAAHLIAHGNAERLWQISPRQ